MVCLELKPNLLLASCCKVEVVNGARGLRSASLALTSLTINWLLIKFSKICWASAWSVARVLTSALKSVPLVWNWPVILKSACALKSRICCSRSTTRRTAGDWTRPALLPPGTLRQTTGDNSKPTRRSRICRACWALTSCISMMRGLAIADSRALLVISWKTIRLVVLGSSFNTSVKCQAIASPSRSSSVASQTVSACLTDFLSSVMTFFLSGSIS